MFEDNDIVDLTDRFNELFTEYATSENNCADFDSWHEDDLLELRAVIVQAVELLGIE